LKHGGHFAKIGASQFLILQFIVFNTNVAEQDQKKVYSSYEGKLSMVEETILNSLAESGRGIFRPEMYSVMLEPFEKTKAETTMLEVSA